MVDIVIYSQSPLSHIKTQCGCGNEEDSKRHTAVNRLSGNAV